MQVEIWSDVVCPWCAVGKLRFERALEGFAHADQVEVRWRSFELDPTAPAEVQGSYVERLVAKYGASRAQAQAMIDRMVDTAAAEGLHFRFDIARPGNTFDAHRVLHLAVERGVQLAVKDRLLAGYHEQGEAIGRHDTLIRLGAEAGLDAGEVTEVLGGTAYTDQVREDLALARTFGISGVPFFVIERRYGISGAQPPQLLRSALEQAWNERTPLTVVPGAPSAEACTDDTCAT